VLEIWLHRVASVASMYVGIASRSRPATDYCQVACVDCASHVQKHHLFYIKCHLTKRWISQHHPLVLAQHDRIDQILIFPRMEMANIIIPSTPCVECQRCGCVTSAPAQAEVCTCANSAVMPITLQTTSTNGSGSGDPDTRRTSGAALEQASASATKVRNAGEEDVA